MRTEGLPTQVACRVLEVSQSGFYAWRSRPPSARSIRHAWLTDMIHHIHEQSRGTYGARRVHAELRLGHGITVGHNAVVMLMRRAGLAGLTGNRSPRRRTRPVDTPVDLVDRNFVRFEPDQLWVTDITEHPTRQAQGLLRCGAGRVQPPGRRLVDRQHGDLGTGHLRVRYGGQPDPGTADQGGLRIRSGSFHGNRGDCRCG